MTHVLPSLGYDYDALEPFIDTETMKIHHTKHHQTYVDKLNAALESYPDLAEQGVDHLISDLEKIPEEIRAAVRNHGGGHSNHEFFWQLLKKDVSLGGEIKTAIERDFGSFKDFQSAFSSRAALVFGSGWTWLVTDNGKLSIVTTANQDSPLNQGKKAVLGLDVWEHAYYLKYQNRRPDYINAFFNIINWDRVNELYQE